MKHEINLSNSQINFLVDEWIHNKIYREILKSRLIDGLTFEEIAEKYNYSVRHIKNVVYKSEEQLFNHIP